MGEPARGVCFHGWHECAFCRFPGPLPVTAKQKCATCGRGRKPRSNERCAACRLRQFWALRLF